MTTLENLYYGNIAPYEVNVVSGSEYDKVSKLVIRHDEALIATLTEQQKKHFKNSKNHRWSYSTSESAMRSSEVFHLVQR